MENKMESKTSASSKIFHSVWEFLKHPITSLAIGILLTLLFYNLQIKEIEPRFSISEPELLAKQILGEPNLKLFWGDEEIQDISSVKIAFWNSGRQYLDESSISKTEPIRISIPQGVTVLYSDVILTSRNELKFKTSLQTSSNNEQFILIEIEGDEALEYKDGAVIKVLFTGSPKTNFFIKGRIKGSVEGFVETPWAQGITTDIIFLILAIVIMPLSSLWLIRVGIIRFQLGVYNKLNPPKFVGIIELGIGSLVLIYLIYFGFTELPNKILLLSQPTWLK